MTDVPVRPLADVPSRSSQPLIGIPMGDDPDAVQYFTSEEDADRALAADPTNRELAFSAIGSWQDIDFDEMLDEMDRIRHANPPTPPIDLDV